MPFEPTGTNLQGTPISPTSPTDGQALVYDSGAEEYIPTDITPTGGLVFQGNWDASTNTPDLITSPPDSGKFWYVSVAGSTDLGGITDWAIGDWAVSKGSGTWVKVDNSESVVSVNTKVGAVVLDPDDLDDSATTNKFATVAELADIATNTSKRHDQGTDLGLDTGGTNPITAVTIKDHIDDVIGNPHVVTAAQVDAYTKSELDASPVAAGAKIDKIIGTDDAIVRSDGTAGAIKNASAFIAEQNVAETVNRIIINGDVTYPNAVFESKAFDSSSIAGLLTTMVGAAPGVWELFVGYFGPIGENMILNSGDRALRISTVNQDAGKNSQPLVMVSGNVAEDNTGSDDSGLVLLESGEVKTGGSGNSGPAHIGSGNVDSGDSGPAGCKSGTSASGTRGAAYLDGKNPYIKLDTNDGTDSFLIKDSDDATVASVDSNGDIVGNSLGLGGTPGASAIFQADSTTQGLLPPRMTSAQRDAIGSPAAGLLLYDATNNAMNYYNAASWRQFITSPAATLEAGGIPFATGGCCIETDSENLFWNNTTKRLGIGTATPNATLDVTGLTPGNVGGFPAGVFQVTSPNAAVNASAVITGHNSFGGNKQLWYLGSSSSSNDNITFRNRQNGSLTLATNDLDRVTIQGDGKVGIGTPNPDRLLHAESSTAFTNVVSYAQRLSHITSGIPAVNIGVGMEFEVETSAGNNEILATIEVVATDVGVGTEDGDIIFKTMAAGVAATEAMRITSGGDVKVVDCLRVSNEITLETDGSASDPGFTWEEDKDTGLYRIGENSIAISAGAAEVLRFTNAEIYASKRFKLITGAILFSGADLEFGSGNSTAVKMTLKSDGKVAIGLTPTANMDGLSIEAGRLTIKETTTPTADADYGKVYCKADDKLYFQDGAGVEHEVAFVI